MLPLPLKLLLLSNILQPLVKFLHLPGEIVHVRFLALLVDFGFSDSDIKVYSDLGRGEPSVGVVRSEADRVLA